MKHKKTPFCKAPFLIGFTATNNLFRDCCAKRPRLLSDPGSSFKEWWKSDKLNQFRKDLLETDRHPIECVGCEIAEKQHGRSFRTAVNEWTQTDFSHPAAWNIMFGNICNLACWICNEHSSSVIFQHKKRSKLLSGEDLTEKKFKEHWPELRENILLSYQHHKSVTLTLLGGEPLYNKTVIDFLHELIEMNLAHRTRLEFHTNGTVYPYKIFPKNQKSPWQYVCSFISLDAVGRYAEWLRYGCDWNKVDKVVDALENISDYTEIQCTLTVLNINQLPDLQSYAETKNINLSIKTTDNPDYMALTNWDMPQDSLLVNETSERFKLYYQLIGKTAKKGSSDRLKKYIRNFDGVRSPLSDFDRTFAEKIGW